MANQPTINSRTALQCPEWLNKRHSPSIYEVARKRAASDFEKLLTDAGIAHENRVLESFAALGLKIIHVEGDSAEGRLAQTAAALNGETVNIIAHASLGPGLAKLLGGADEAPKLSGIPLVSEPDLLIRVPADGAWGSCWLPVDIKAHTSPDRSTGVHAHRGVVGSAGPESAAPIAGKLDRDDALQLAHYWRHLTALGLTSGDAWGGIIGKDIQHIIWQRLDEPAYRRDGLVAPALDSYDAEVAARIPVIESSVLRNVDNSLLPISRPEVRPGAKFGCGACEWWPVCEEELMTVGRTGHVTLLAEVTPDKAAQNIPDALSIGELARIDSIGAAKRREYRIRAEAYLSGEVRPLVDNWVMPRFDIEIDIDLESSQGALLEAGAESGEDFIYLFGWLRWDRRIQNDPRTAETGAFCDYSHAQASELQVLMDTWTFLAQEVVAAQEAGKSIGIFHFHTPEPHALRLLARKYAGSKGVPTTSEVERFIAEYMVDMLPLVKRLAFPPTAKSPLCNYSIKTLAPLAGFAWRFEDAGGATSLLKYVQAVSMTENCQFGCPGCYIHQDLSVCGEHCPRCWLNAYNQDDVRATAVLRDWLDARVSCDVTLAPIPG